jgi:hypothetical protein
MEWLSENWLWILIFVIFIGIHLFGHGGHGKHGHNSKNKSDEKNEKHGHH